MGSSLPKGISKQVLVVGHGGQRVKRGDVVTVHCSGSVVGGPRFWSTRDDGQEAFSFTCGIGQVMLGWDHGVLSMVKGEMALFTFEPEMGYGVNGFPAWQIPPNATLVFEIELLLINGK